MPADDPPIEPDRLPDAPHEKTPITARERRETERLITDWERETRQLGHALALMTLDVSAMTGPKWAHRFIIAVDPVVETRPSFSTARDSPRSWDCRRRQIIPSR